MRVGLFFGSFDPPHIGHVNVVDESHIGISTNAIKGQLGGEENEVKAIMWVKISDLDNYQWAFNHRHLIEGIFYTYVDYEEVEGLDDLFAE